MAAKGNEAKEIIITKLKEIFGQNFVGVFDKKVYINVEESSGELVQIALTLTCPKTYVGIDVSSTVNTETTEAPTNNDIEFTNQERENVQKLLSGLGL